MPFIEIGLDDVKENTPVPEGEYNLRIVKVTDGQSKKGNAMTTCVIAVEDERFPAASAIMHWLTYPDASTPPDQKELRRLDIARFLQVFGVKPEARGFDTAVLEGATGRCSVYQESGDDGNTYNRLRLPKLRK